MGRARTAVGTFGEFTYITAPNGKIMARVRFRDDDGQLRLVQAGDTRKSAKRALKQKLTRRDTYSAGVNDLGFVLTTRALLRRVRPGDRVTVRRWWSASRRPDRIRR